VTEATYLILCPALVAAWFLFGWSVFFVRSRGAQAAQTDPTQE
jgi:hypothetical protein